MPATYEPIATTTITTSTVSFSLSSIPSTYTDLRLVLIYLAAGDYGWPSFRFNGDTGSNYSQTYIRGVGVSAGSSRTTNATKLELGGYQDASSTVPSLTIMDIFSYAGGTNKTVLFDYSSDSNGAGSTYRQVGLWRSTSAINSITLTRENWNFISGTTATLYGIKNA
jgi:hypothetical protein